MSLCRSSREKRKVWRIRICRFLSCEVIWFSASRISCSLLASATDERRYSGPITLEPEEATMKDCTGLMDERERYLSTCLSNSVGAAAPDWPSSSSSSEDDSSPPS